MFVCLKFKLQASFSVQIMPKTSINTNILLEMLIKRIKHNKGMEQCVTEGYLQRVDTRIVQARYVG